MPDIEIILEGKPAHLCISQHGRMLARTVIEIIGGLFSVVHELLEHGRVVRQMTSTFQVTLLNTDFCLHFFYRIHMKAGAFVRGAGKCEFAWCIPILFDAAVLDEWKGL